MSRRRRRSSGAVLPARYPATLVQAVAVIAIATVVVGVPNPVQAQDIGDTSQHSGAVTITSNRPTALQGIDDLVFTVTREVATVDDLDVPVEMSPGILAPTQLRHTVTIAANQTSTKLTVSTTARDMNAATGQVTATVGDGEFHDVGDPSSASVRVYVGNGLVTLRFNASSLPVDESVGWSNDEVKLIARTSPGVPPPFESFSVAVITVEGTASRVDDYQGWSRTFTLQGESRVTWVANKGSYVSSIPVAVWPIRDDLDEEDENVRSTATTSPRPAADGHVHPRRHRGAPLRTGQLLVDRDHRG